MVISSGKYKVIESGSAIIFDANSDVVISIKAAFNFEFKIIFIFEENGGERNLVKEVNPETNVVVYKCINFDVGAGTAEPIEIGHVASKTMYLHFWIEKLSANSYVRSLQYTVYKEG